MGRKLSKDQMGVVMVWRLMGVRRRIHLEFTHEVTLEGGTACSKMRSECEGVAVVGSVVGLCSKFCSVVYSRSFDENCEKYFYGRENSF